MHSIRDRARKGLVSYGMTVSLMDPTMIEMAYCSGYDFVRIDCEHILFDNQILGNMLRTARLLSMPCQIRVDGWERITSFLSLEASGIMVPHVDSVGRAKKAIDMVKFAPLGERGMDGGARLLRYGGMKRSDYIERANGITDVIVQIESKKGISCIDDILSLEGIDMVATGKADLSQSLGVPGQKDHPDVLAAEEYIVKKALEYDKIPTLAAYTRDRVEELMEMGVRCFLIAKDETLAYKAIEDKINGIKHEYMTNNFREKYKMEIKYD